MLKAKVICPYCGMENEYFFDGGNRHQPTIVECDNLSGGCEYPFIVIPEVVVKTDVRRIEGFKADFTFEEVQDQTKRLIEQVTEQVKSSDKEMETY